LWQGGLPFSSRGMKTAASVEKEVREKTGAGLVRVGGEIRNPFGCKDFLVDKEVPRAGTAVAREDRVGRVGHDLGLAAVFQIPASRNSSAIPSTHMLIPYFAIV